MEIKARIIIIIILICIVLIFVKKCTEMFVARKIEERLKKSQVIKFLLL